MTTLLGLTECNHSKIKWLEQNNKELRIIHLDIVFDTYLKIYHKKKGHQLVAFFNEIRNYSTILRNSGRSKYFANSLSVLAEDFREAFSLTAFCRFSYNIEVLLVRAPRTALK